MTSTGPQARAAPLPINAVALTDPEVFPDERALGEVLGRSLSAYMKLIALYERYGLTHEWRYYRDGKASPKSRSPGQSRRPALSAGRKRPTDLPPVRRQSSAPLPTTILAPISANAPSHAPT